MSVGHDAPETRENIERFLQQLCGVRRSIVSIRERPAGAQGYSGSQVRYYDVRSRDPQGRTHHETVVSKAACLLERRILRLLADQRCAVPPVYIPDLTGDRRAPVYMPYLDPLPALYAGHRCSPITLSIADGLAGIHAANRLRPPPWLPHTSDDWLGRLWLRAWRELWEAALADPAFRAEFGAYTPRLEAAMAGLMRILESLTAEAATLTLLNVDLHPDHIRLWQGRACFIDWEQSSYGSLYLDLPNHFTAETALVYRDALARHGHEIPEVEFLERFHQVGRYMGLRYLGAALEQWAEGGESRRRGRWFLYYTFALALHGR
ncbi:MAG: hypothetical protein JXA74_17800 [Anaerolineae bacterium]|nr:hypothetical protein [Anaerolineae bacterium]